ncbi:MAG: hypothetical protein V3T03_07445, partial [Candidatus Bipolaricaulota bacterium]
VPEHPIEAIDVVLGLEEGLFVRQAFGLGMHDPLIAAKTTGEKFTDHGAKLPATSRGGRR